MKKILRSTLALATLLGAFAAAPSLARATEAEAEPAAGFHLKCEKCTCNWNFVCECTNCTISFT